MGTRTFLARTAPALALVAAVCVLYAQTAGHEFIDYDTGTYLTANPRVLAGLTGEGLRWAFDNTLAGNWHPLTWLSHMLDAQLFGLRPAGHLLENAAWHAANAVLVLALFRGLGLAPAFAFAGALFFAIHPLRAESVAWIAERKDLLSAFFGLASLLAWLSWSREPRAVALLAALALYAASLMSKAMLVTLPGLLVLIEVWPLGRSSWRPRRRDLATLAFLALALGCALLTVHAQSSAGAVQQLATLPLALRVENALDSCLWYLGKTLWPSGLAFYYPLEPHAARMGEILLASGALLALSAAAWLARRALPGVLFGWLWFLGTLVPVIGLVQVGGQAHADRYTYLPGLGLAFALACAAQHALLPRTGARVLGIVGALAALALGAAGWRQIATWHDTETLANQALEVTERNHVALDLLGAYDTEHGRVEEAIPLLREALRIAPTDPDALSNLGGTLLRAGELAESEKLLVRASELVPWRAQTWSLLGGLYYTQRRYPEALAALERALEREPATSARSRRAAWCSRRSVATTRRSRRSDARPRWAATTGMRDSHSVGCSCGWSGPRRRARISSG
ncbi:MAG: tetratricopeptide repeat protein [Planctomycetes bacterium]|nr:tetratricopeptide repeat protein [Planctomycetota bacterium]